jgi:hypothetical protein
VIKTAGYIRSLKFKIKGVFLKCLNGEFSDYIFGKTSPKNLFSNDLFKKEMLGNQ